MSEFNIILRGTKKFKQKRIANSLRQLKAAAHSLSACESENTTYSSFCNGFASFFCCKWSEKNTRKTRARHLVEPVGSVLKFRLKKFRAQQEATSMAQQWRKRATKIKHEKTAAVKFQRTGSHSSLPRQTHAQFDPEFEFWVALKSTLCTAIVRGCTTDTHHCTDCLRSQTLAPQANAAPFTTSKERTTYWNRFEWTSMKAVFSFPSFSLFVT